MAAVRSSCQLPPGVELTTVGAINGETNWTDALRGVNIVIHLAARVHKIRDEAANPLTRFRAVNVDGTINLAQQAARARVRRFIYLSSIKVNGGQMLPGQPFTEQDKPAPLDLYGLSKYEAEVGLRKIAQLTGLEVVIIRPPLVYGPGVKANFLKLLNWLDKEVPLPFGAIKNHRSLVALDNLLDLIITCLDHPDAVNQSFFVSDGEDLSTTNLLKRTGEALGKPVRLIPVPQKIIETGLKYIGRGDLAQRLCGSLQVDISKARDLLDWKPVVTIDEALRKTAKAYWADR